MDGDIVVGIDSHKDTHYAAVLTRGGRRLGARQFGATAQGYNELSEWVETFGTPASFGVECTGSYAAGLTRHLLERGMSVAEINTTNKHARARRGKDDALDAEMAARHVLTGADAIVPKSSTGAVESIRMLLLTRESAVNARTVALQQIQDVLITAPVALRESITYKRGKGAVEACSRLRPDLSRLSDPEQAAKLTLRTLGRRASDLAEEIAVLERELDTLVTATAPTMRAACGVGPVNGAQLLVTAGQNIGRLHSEAAFARLCGVAPVPASSGKTTRMRLHRGGDRAANRALYLITVCRLRYDQRTIDYMQRRRGDGLSKKDVIRCLKRFVAREVFNDLVADLAGCGSMSAEVAVPAARAPSGVR